MLEILEGRALFSLSAVTLAGPLTPGDTWQYDAGGIAFNGEIVGIARGSDNPKVSGANLLSIGVTDNDFASVPNSWDYQMALSGKGLIEYGNAFTPGNGFVLPTYYFIDRPLQVLFPPVVTAGHVYQNTFGNVVLTGEYGTRPAQPSSLQLNSDQLQSITVPAGTFGCYEIVNSGQGITEWISPGVGVVQESLAHESGPYYQLASYTVAANPGQSRITPDILSTTLSATAIPGSAVHVAANLELTNTGTAAYKTGRVTISVYATNDQTIDSKAILLGTIKQTITLDAGGSENVSIPINRIPHIAGKLDGDYTLYARTTDAFGQIFDAGSSFITDITPGVANLHTTLTAAIAPQATAGPALITISITNSGEIRSQKSAAIELFSSSDLNQSPGNIVATTVLQIQILPINLAAGQTRTFHLRLTPKKLARADQNMYLWADLISRQDDPSPLSGISLPHTN